MTTKRCARCADDAAPRSNYCVRHQPHLVPRETVERFRWQMFGGGVLVGFALAGALAMVLT